MDDSGLVWKIKNSLSEWRTIDNLRGLDNHRLQEFWENLEILIADLSDELKTCSTLDHLRPVILVFVIELLRLGEFIRAEAICMNLADASRRLNHRDLNLRAYIFLGYIHFNLSEFDKSFHAYSMGLNLLSESLEDQTRRVVFLSNLSMVVAETEDLDHAVEYGRRALRLIHSLKPSDFNRAAEKTGTPRYDEQRSAVMSNLGALYQEMGTRATQRREKDSLLRRSLRYHARSIHGDIPLFDHIRSQANKSLTIMHLGKQKEAYSTFRKLDKQCEKKPVELIKIRSWIQGFMSETALHLGRSDDALKHCHTGLKLAVESADPIGENATMAAFLKSLKAISNTIFKGSHTNRQFLTLGMPIIQELLNFLEDKDWYTARDHSRGVAGISLVLFDVLAESNPGILAKYDRRTLEIASLLHDIGKLWIPWGILNRLTPLWDRDFEIIKRHPDKGREFLQELGFANIGDILGRHHERPDGAGYPNGGDIGGLSGRILAVADCFEAMTTQNRLYRKPFPRDVAVRRMMTLAGRQFDETVVNVLPEAVKRL